MPREPFPLDTVQRDRAAGALLATAAGDALGTWGPAPGEWGPATATALAVAEVASIAGDLTSPARLDDIAQRWAWWAHGRPLEATCLTRAVPVALATLDPAADGLAARSARKVCELTHPGDDAAEATVLWTFAVRHAVRTGQLDLRIGLAQLDGQRAALWAERIATAEQAAPADVTATGDVVAVVQAAWSAITTTIVPQHDPRADHLRLALEAAVGLGGSATAAVAGGLLGAAHGATALPWQWRAVLRGWPGLRAHGLARLAEKIVNGGERSRIGCTGFWREEPDPRRHPHDDGVWIGVAARLEKLPEGVEAVVSLCPVADEDMPPGVLHLEVSLAEEGANNLDFVLLDTARAIEALRAQGLTVFVHGRATRSRAPAVAALYGARRTGIDIEQALAEVCAALPDADPTAEFRAALRRLSASTARSPR